MEPGKCIIAPLYSCTNSAVFCIKLYFNLFLFLSVIFSIIHVGRIKSLHVVRKRNLVQQQVKYIPEPNVSLS